MEAGTVGIARYPNGGAANPRKGVEGRSGRGWPASPGSSWRCERTTMKPAPFTSGWGIIGRWSGCPATIGAGHPPFAWGARCDGFRFAGPSADGGRVRSILVEEPECPIRTRGRRWEKRRRHRQNRSGRHRSRRSRRFRASAASGVASGACGRTTARRCDGTRRRTRSSGGGTGVRRDREWPVRLEPVETRGDRHFAVARMNRLRGYVARCASASGSRRQKGRQRLLVENPDRRAAWRSS